MTIPNVDHVQTFSVSQLALHLSRTPILASRARKECAPNIYVNAMLHALPCDPTLRLQQELKKYICTSQGFQQFLRKAEAPHTMIHQILLTPTFTQTTQQWTQFVNETMLGIIDALEEQREELQDIQQIARFTAHLFAHNQDAYSIIALKIAQRNHGSILYRELRGFAGRELTAFMKSMSNIDELVDKTIPREQQQNMYKEALTDLASESPPLQAAGFSAIRELINKNEKSLPDVETLFDLIIVGIRSDEGYVQHHAGRALAALKESHAFELGPLVAKCLNTLNEAQRKLVEK